MNLSLRFLSHFDALPETAIREHHHQKHAKTVPKYDWLTATTAGPGELASSTLAVPSPEKDRSCDGLEGHQTAPEPR